MKLKYGGKEYPEDCISGYKLIGGAVNKNSDDKVVYMLPSNNSQQGVTQ